MRHEGSLVSFWHAANRCLDKISAFLLAVLLLSGIYGVCDSIYMLRHSDSRLSALFGDEAAGPEGNPAHSVGRLSIEHTSIDYPVMQGSNNEEYLNKAPDGSYSLAGSVFLDWRNSPDWSDAYNLIYGHHMSGGRMFGALDRYLDPDWLKAHTKGTLHTDSGDFLLTVFAAAEADASDQILFDAGGKTDLQDLAAYITAHAAVTGDDRELPVLLVSSADAGAKAPRILALSTCHEAGTTSRLVVFALMEPM